METPAPTGPPVLVPQGAPDFETAEIRPGGDLVAVAHEHTGVDLVALDGTVRAVLPGRATHAVFTGDGSHVVVVSSKSANDEVRLWDVATGEHRSLGIGWGYEAFPAPTGSRVAVTADGRITVVDAHGVVSRIEGRATTASFSRDGALLATQEHGEVSVYQASTGKLLGKLGSLAYFGADMAFDPADERLAVVDRGGVILWGPKAKAPPPPVKVCSDDFPFMRIAWSPDGGLAVACKLEVVILDHDGAQRRKLPLPAGLPGLVIGFDGERVLFRGQRQITALDATTGDEAWHVDSACGNDRFCNLGVHVSPDGRTALMVSDRDPTCARGQRVDLVDLRSGVRLRTFGGADHWSRLATTGSGPVFLQTVRGWTLNAVVSEEPAFAWDPRSDAVLPPFRVDQGHCGPLPSPPAVDLSPDGHTILEASGPGDASFTLVDRATGGRRTYPARVKGEGSLIGFSPHGDYVLAQEKRGPRGDSYFLLFSAADGRLRGEYLLDPECHDKPLLSSDDRTLGIPVGPGYGKPHADEPERFEHEGCQEVRVIDVRSRRLVTTKRNYWEVHEYDKRTRQTVRRKKLHYEGFTFDAKGNVFFGRIDDGSPRIVRESAELFVVDEKRGTRHHLPAMELALDNPWLAHLAPDGSYIAYPDGRGIALLRVKDGVVLHRTATTPPLYYTDDGRYDGDPAALEHVRFRMGPDLARSPMAKAGDPGTPAPTPGLLRDFLGAAKAEDPPEKAQAEGGEKATSGSDEMGYVTFTLPVDQFPKGVRTVTLVIRTPSGKLVERVCPVGGSVKMKGRKGEVFTVVEARIGGTVVELQKMNRP